MEIVLVQILVFINSVYSSDNDPCICDLISGARHVCIHRRLLNPFNTIELLDPFEIIHSDVTYDTYESVVTKTPLVASWQRNMVEK